MADHAEAVVTLLARSKMVKARAGISPLPKITGIAFGDGGTDSEQQVLAPDGNQTELNMSCSGSRQTGISFCRTRSAGTNVHWNQENLLERISVKRPFMMKKGTWLR